MSNNSMGVNVINQASGENWHAYHGDCVEVARGLPDRSVALSVFSPPFASLYTYSNSSRDMGNVRDDEEFFAHFDFIVAELARVMMRGRVVAFHCMDMPSAKSRDGHIGLRDFPGDLIRAFEKHGFHFHSRVTIWKDPVTAMQRTKALGLLHKTVRENASMSRSGIPDYVIAMRAPGDVPVEERVKHTVEEYPVDKWQQIASPVWAVATAEGVKAAIDPQDTLQYQSVREHDDERHICPLQLEVILRCVELWTNPGEVVFSPYMGIGSEGHIALGGATRAGRRLEKPRRFVGAELKASYFKQAVANLAAAERAPRQTSLFDLVGAGGARKLREALAADAVGDASPAAQEPAQGPSDLADDLAPGSAPEAAPEPLCGPPIDHSPLPSSLSPLVRVVVVSESGDWGKCRKGLVSWSPDKTPGAGSASGGRLAPLVALWCPVSAETGGDADALLERLTKMKRRFIDLGEIERSEMSRHLMDASTIRARWDAAHPGAAVGVVAVTKVKRGKVA